MKYVIGLMLASLSIFTYAQRTPLACQDDAAAGMRWDLGKWNTASFIEDKFILVLEGRTLTKDSVAKALKEVTPSDITCNATPGRLYISCHDGFGGSLFFSIMNSKGAISNVLGAISESNKRDTLSVRAFTCTPF